MSELEQAVVIVWTLTIFGGGCIGKYWEFIR
jgi:hypothetical protein